MQKNRRKAFIMIQSTLLVTSKCSQKNIFPIYQLTLPEGLRIMVRQTLGPAEQNGRNHYFIECHILIASQGILPLLR